ncbi:MAG: protein YgfX [Lysobacterales bacterium]
MNRFASQLDLNLSLSTVDLILLAVPACVSALVMVTVVWAQTGAGVMAGVAALFLLWVALVMVHASRVADSGWQRLIAHADGTFELADGRHRIVPVTICGNFQCPWGVLITINHAEGRHRQWIWRSRQPDDFRHLLVALDRRGRNL